MPAHATASSTIKQARLTRQAERKGTTLRLMLALGVQIWAASCPIRKHMSSDASKADARTPRHAVLLVPVGRPPQLLRARCVPEAVYGGCSAGQGCPFLLSLRAFPPPDLWPAEGPLGLTLLVNWWALLRDDPHLAFMICHKPA